MLDDSFPVATAEAVAVPLVAMPTLPQAINAAHAAVRASGRTMLLEARKAGEHLLKAKDLVQHGKFKAWIEANCKFSYATAQRYMRVSKKIGADFSDIDGGVEGFLEAISTPRPKAPCPTVTTIDRDDAAHALKLQALVERGSTEAERDVAKRKLEAFAKGFGHTAEALVEKAQGILPDAGKTTYQAEAEAFKAEAAALRAQLNAILTRTQELETEVRKLSREELVARYIGLVLEREGLTELKKAA